MTTYHSEFSGLSILLLRSQVSARSVLSYCLMGVIVALTLQTAVLKKDIRHWQVKAEETCPGKPIATVLEQGSLKCIYARIPPGELSVKFDRGWLANSYTGLTARRYLGIDPSEN